jgi:hypothetical protein
MTAVFVLLNDLALSRRRPPAPPLSLDGLPAVDSTAC